MNDNSQANLPQATSDLDVAKSDMDDFGYCLLANALTAEQVQLTRQRLLDQVKAEEQLGVSSHLDDGKQLLKFLFNKGKVFRDILTHPGLRELVKHVLGEAYLLSSYQGHLAHPGGTTRFHTDQFWMPAPANGNGVPAVKPGDITRAGNRGHHVAGAVEATGLSPAVVCNAMWMLDDFTETNGATIVVPGSHRSGRQPDHALDEEENWVSVVAPAGSVAIFEGRTWHSTGENTGNSTRIGLTTNFCAPQFRQQENFLIGASPEVLEEASDEMLALIGFQAWQGYGGIESNYGMVHRGDYAIGELVPE